MDKAKMPARPIVNIDTLTFEHRKHGRRFEARLASIGPEVGARRLGYRLTVVPPGKAAWPYHAHLVNEEMVFVVEGKGLLQIGDANHPIRSGDVIALPPGGAETAHQIVNDSDDTLTYLCVSTMNEPDIGLYPDSGKFGIFAGTAPGGNKSGRTFAYFGRVESAVDYWDGED